jgi:integrin beta 8
MIMDIIKISVNSQLFVCVYSEKINTSLGSAGSCLQKFSALPYLRCDHTNVCYYGQTNDLTYYLSTTEPMPMMPVQRDQIRPYISRCAVCEAPANVMSFHSLSMTPPPCPGGWNILWQGYSFVMVSTRQIRRTNVR